MTNFEIVTKDPETLARVITTMLQEKEMEFVRKLDDAGISASAISLDTELQVQIHKEWLEQEAKLK